MTIHKTPILLALLAGVAIGRYGSLIVPNLSMAVLVLVACFFGWVAYTTRLQSENFTPGLVNLQFAAIASVLGVNIAGVWEMLF